MMQENTSFYGKIHTAGKTFAQLPVATVATNFISTHIIQVTTLSEARERKKLSHVVSIS